MIYIIKRVILHPLTLTFPQPFQQFIWLGLHFETFCMKSKLRLPLFLLIVGMMACKNSQKDFSIAGNIEGMPQQTVYLESIGVENISVIDSAKSDNKGYFELSGAANGAGLYRLRFLDDQFLLLSIDKGNIQVTGNWSELAESYTVKGSAPSESLRGFLTIARGHINKISTLSVVMDSLQSQNDSMLVAAKKDMQDMNFEFTRYIENYADTTKYFPNAFFASKMLNPAAEKEFFQAFSKNLSGRFPNNNMAKEFGQRIDELYAAGEKALTSGIQRGSTAPDIELPTADGKTITLNSFKGKYVLVDFWASWCGPCRGENPNVVKAYNQFKGKNFTILGVSLDTDKDKWLAAIAKDNLTWTHVSDLKGWESVAARSYNVESIPTNFLIDPTGKVIARDLRGEGLIAELERVLK